MWLSVDLGRAEGSGFVVGGLQMCVKDLSHTFQNPATYKSGKM